MAWYNAGDWTAIRRDRQGHLLQQMMYAINEREALVSRTLTTWTGYATLPSGVEAWTGYAWTAAGVLLNQIRAAIPSLYNTAEAERFVQSDGTDWTSALLFTAAGYGAAWLPSGGHYDG